MWIIITVGFSIILCGVIGLCIWKYKCREVEYDQLNRIVSFDVNDEEDKNVAL